MKIKKIDFIRILFYPHIFNPFVYLFLISIILHALFISWITAKYNDGYYHISASLAKFKSCWKDIFLGLMGLFVNTFWFNYNLTSCYLKYLEHKLFPPYPIGDWRREYELNIRHERFQKLFQKIIHDEQ